MSRAAWMAACAAGLMTASPVAVHAAGAAASAPAARAAPAASVAKRVQQIVAEQLGVPLAQVKPTADFVKDLGADSLDTVELVMAFEDEFDIEIPDAEAERVRTVGQAIAYVEARLAASPKPKKKTP